MTRAGGSGKIVRRVHVALAADEWEVVEEVMNATGASLASIISWIVAEYLRRVVEEEEKDGAGGSR